MKAAKLKSDNQQNFIEELSKLYIQLQKDLATSKENINDIKEGEYVVHTIHGVGIYTGISKQEIDRF